MFIKMWKSATQSFLFQKLFDEIRQLECMMGKQEGTLVGGDLLVSSSTICKPVHHFDKQIQSHAFVC